MRRKLPLNKAKLQLISGEGTKADSGNGHREAGYCCLMWI